MPHLKCLQGLVAGQSPDYLLQTRFVDSVAGDVQFPDCGVYGEQLRKTFAAFLVQTIPGKVQKGHSDVSLQYKTEENSYKSMKQKIKRRKIEMF